MGLQILKQEQDERVEAAKQEKKDVKLQMAQAGKKAFWGVLGAIGTAVLATTCAVGVTVVAGGAAGGAGVALKRWLSPVDGESELAEIEARMCNAKSVLQGATDLKDKYEKLQINIRATEAHTGTLLSILRMATGSVRATVGDIKDVMNFPELFEALGLNKPEFFESWLARIEEMREENLALHTCCQAVVLNFGMNADIHAASSSP